MQENCTILNQGAALERPTYLIEASVIPSPRTMPRCDSGLLHDTRNFTGTSGNVFERPLAQEGRPSTFCNNSMNLASSKPDISETSWTEMKRKCADSITSLSQWRWFVESYWWNLFSQWYNGLSESSYYEMESLKIS